MKKLWMIIAICIMLAVLAYAEEQEVFTSGDYEHVLLKDGAAEITDYSGDDEEQETVSSSMVKVEAEVSNTDILKDRAGSVILDPENVVHMYIEVYPDGSIICEDFVLYANEDYKMTLEYNEVSEVKEFHTGEDDGHYYILSIDYATGDVAFKMVPEQGLLAAGNYTYYVNEDGTVTISGWKGDDKEIVIPEEIDGRAVTTIGNWTFSYCKDLTTIKVPDSVTTIGSKAFKGCNRVTLIVEHDTYAEQYAKENEISYTYAG